MEINTEKFEEFLVQAGRTAVIGHLNPDGDCVGSVTAMYSYLKGRGIAAKMIFPSPVPHTLEFLLPPESKDLCTFSPDDSTATDAVLDADLIVCLDLNCLGRTEGLAAAISSSNARRVLIDHHVKIEDEHFDLEYSTTEVSSASELLFDILMAMPDINGDIGRLSVGCAESLYTGMMTDTNNFSNSVWPGTFEMASKLMARGIDRNAIQSAVMQNYPEGRVRLMGHLLNDRLVVMHREKAAYMTLSREEKLRFGTGPGDTEGFVNIPLSIGGVEISAFFSEDDSGTFIRVSLRSKGDVNVNDFAKNHFNGGGHRNASGGRLHMSLGEVPAYFEKSVREFLCGRH